MFNVIFTNIRFPGNVGDYSTAPTNYYKFPFNYEHLHFIDILTKYNLQDYIVIIGGGGLITTKGNYLQNIIETLVENNKVIFWGVGGNTTSKNIGYDILYHHNVKLVGIRDIVYGLNFEYVPCVSCKHELFDRDYEEGNGIGLVEHARFDIPIDLPKIKNNTTIEQFVEFIASKEIIISTTYHGVYWAQLLNKKVLYYVEDFQTINSKMVHLKHRIPYCNKDNWENKINSVSRSHDMLAESRKLNDDFYQKVVKTVQLLL